MNVYDITDLSFKVTWLDAYTQPTVNAKYVVTVEARGNLVEQKEVDYNQTPLTFNKGIVSNEAFTIKVQAKSPTNGMLGDVITETIKTPKGEQLLFLTFHNFLSQLRNLTITRTIRI